MPALQVLNKPVRKLYRQGHALKSLIERWGLGITALPVKKITFLTNCGSETTHDFLTIEPGKTVGF